MPAISSATAEVGGRATIGAGGTQTGSNIGAEVRSVQSRAAAQTVAPRETIAEAKERLEQTADLNKSCQEQYNDCMDQFCAVIDANQKRCSCSANLSRYTRVESAVKEANTQLNEVAQRIRYVGLSADEIRAIMSATEAEDALTGTRDMTESRNMLDEIEAMIVNPNSVASTSTTNDSSFGLDMDVSFSSDSADMFNLDFLNTNTSNSMTNLRGTDLFNAAKKRCATILTQCRNVGASADQITANYELAIDKDCIAYEQGLTKMNETLATNVRSANLMLQKARLAVQTNKNQYDAKGCIAALDACMIDDMVCGEDYTKCLDPTKTYIDENGNVVLGKNIGKILDFTKSYDNSSIDSDFIQSSMSAQFDSANGAGIVRYLMQKIGTGDKVTDGGLCRAVLDKCQRYTYQTTNTSKYNPYNDVVVNYIQRAMVNIRAAQSQIISDYASTCMTDIATCYSQQVSQVNSWSSSASVDSIYRVMQGACYNVALTCAHAVFHETTDFCPADGKSPDKCIQNISEMFYQSMLCPTNSTFSTTTKDKAGDEDKKRYVNDHCKCVTGYDVQAGGCMLPCPKGKEYASPTATQCTDIKT